MIIGKKIGIIFALCMVTWLVQGQVTARVAGLELNPKYMSLLLQEKQLHHTEDSVVTTIASTRKLFGAATQPTKAEEYGKVIIRLENELFDIRNRIGIVVSEISALEQDYVINGLNTTTATTHDPSTTTPQAIKQSTNLVDNDYFAKNLAPSEFAMLRAAQKQETLPTSLLSTYQTNYNQMAQLVKSYADAPRIEAEEALSKFNLLTAINLKLEDSLTQVWGQIYDDKMFAYTYLLEKMNKGNLLSDFEIQFRETNQVIATARDAVASEVVYGYPLRKKLILSYEVALADLLGYTQARDSLTKVMKTVSTLSYNLPKLQITPRNFIPYADITTTTPSIYNTKNPIPAMEIFRHGTVYMIQLGIFSRQQPISTFRYASPLCYEHLEDGRYRYCLGAFRTQAEAEAGLAQAKKIGFRVPQIIVWRDGVVEQSAKSDPDEEKSTAIITVYRVEIDGEAETMSEGLKSLLNSIAPDKEVSRTTTAEGKFMYTVGSFITQEEAQDIANQLAALPGIATKVLTIEN